MENEIVKKIIHRSGNEELLNILAKELSFSELNSLLMEVYRLKSEEITPAGLMQSYEGNKFVKPAFEDPIKLKELELKIFKTAEAFSFIPVELSPVAPFGACSSVGTVNQNKILSALRNSEVAADSTNSLALHICSLKRKMNTEELNDCGKKMRYCAIHRLIRTQIPDNPRFTPHFKLFCMVTSGRDTGSHEFEKENILEHLNFYKTVLKDLIHSETFKLKLFRIGDDELSTNTFIKVSDFIRNKMDVNADIVEDITRIENQYYRGLQFKIYINIDGSEVEVADGGFVDWSQKLLQNKKERMLISAIGLAPLLSFS